MKIGFDVDGVLTDLENYQLKYGKKYFGEDQVVPLYVEVEDGLRLERALSRERMQDEPDYAELCRRYLADRQDFSEEKLAEAGIDRRYENLDLDKCCLEIVRTIKAF